MDENNIPTKINSSRTIKSYFSSNQVPQQTPPSDGIASQNKRINDAELTAQGKNLFVIKYFIVNC